MNELKEQLIYSFYFEHSRDPHLLLLSGLGWAGLGLAYWMKNWLVVKFWV